LLTTFPIHFRAAMARFLEGGVHLSCRDARSRAHTGRRGSDGGRDGLAASHTAFEPVVTANCAGRSAVGTGGCHPQGSGPTPNSVTLGYLLPWPASSERQS
jgi:hypothetical protein